MLKQKNDISLNRLLTIILLIVFPILFQNEGLAGVTASHSIRDHLKKRIELKKTQKKFSCRGELICGVSLIPQFYQRRGFSPAWSGDEGISPQAGSLIEEINRADQEGLRPDDYHRVNIVSLLKMIEKKQALGERVDPKTWVDLDLLLTDTFMLYSSHLLAGRVNPETIHSNWVVANPNADLINILQSALDSNQIVNVLRDLRPIHDGYIGLKQFLRQYRDIANKEDGSPMLPGTNLRRGDQGASVQRLRDRLVFLGDLEHSNEEPIDLFDETTELAVIKCQKRHGLKSDGIVGPRTLDILNTPIQHRVRQIELNMERWRWIPRDLGNRYLIVNIADALLWVTENRQRIMEMRVIVGRPYRQTPVFSSKMIYMVINPYWNIPTSLVLKDILPKIQKNDNYIAQQGIKVFKDWSKGAPEIDPETVDWKKFKRQNFTYKLRQDPGLRNALGRIKFIFPNKFAVYLHDTPKRSDFKETHRNFSSGCIRTEKPVDLARYLLQDDHQWSRDKLLEIIETGETQVIELQRPITVHLQYWTAWVDEYGRLNFRDDIYDRDRALDQALKERLPDV
ncbi:MAG TPA: L,D-transpeptidase family protein [Desulfobacterales bacterium]|nr:L,D-transpeptidase family protein [Desulfobacterales bacterium]